MNSKIIKRGVIVGVGVQIVFIALVLLSDDFRVAFSNLLKSNMMIEAVFNWVLFLLWGIDIMLIMITPLASLLFLLSAELSN
ncbi:hypothetical protein ACI1TM_10445 [Lactococcus garvieae]|uniref:hypothetical protein n=1 Tax=Lactococcus garvieae TaxID=1363 RepID=UPI003852F6B1